MSIWLMEIQVCGLSKRVKQKICFKLAAFTLFKPKFSFHCLREREEEGYTDQNEREYIDSQLFSLQRPRDLRTVKGQLQLCPLTLIPEEDQYPLIL